MQVHRGEKSDVARRKTCLVGAGEAGRWQGDVQEYGTQPMNT